MKTRYAAIQEWWSNLAARERKAISIGGSLLIIYIVYQWMLIPYLDSIENLRKRINAERDTVAWMQATDKEIATVQTQAKQGEPITPVVLLTLMQKEINAAGLASNLKELRQITNDSIGIRFQRVEFDKMMSLLIKVAKQERITIAQISVISDHTPGLVNADITLRLR